MYSNPFNIILQFVLGIIRLVQPIVDIIFNTTIDVSIIVYGFTPELFWGPRVYVPSLFALITASSFLLLGLWTYQLAKSVLA
jgi:hypothetical protein